jgi:serine/threonine protein kinase
VAKYVGRSERLKGRRLGAYEVVRLIGHGATASVFEGDHVALGKKVAIKVLHEHLAHDGVVRNRFLREGRIAARLRHPNVVEALDVGLDGEVPYLVMELLFGVDLSALLAEQRVLPLERALAIVLPIASGLAAVHAAGIVHRDLKPANIFLARDARDVVTPKLLDFGLSKAKAPAGTSSLPVNTAVAGTVLYMAPEQTQGVKKATIASDQYSLAAILYEAITGRPPFPPEDVHALMERIRTGSIRPPRELVPTLPPAIDAIVLRALSRDPEARFPSIVAFASALLPFAGPTTVAEVGRDFAGVEPAMPPVGSRAPTSSPVSKIGGSFDSPLPCAPGASPFHIKGMPYKGLVRFVEKLVPGGLDAFCDALPDARLRDFLHQPFLATGRYDVFPFVPIFGALSRLLGTPSDDLVRVAAASQCRFDAKNVFKLMFSGKGPTAVADRYGRLNGQYYDFGEYRGTVAGPHKVVLEARDIPAYLAPWWLPMHVAYGEEAVRVIGAKEVESTVDVVAPVPKKGPFPLVRTRYELTWSI